MKRHSFFVRIILFSGFLLAACAPKSNDVREAVERQMTQFPQTMMQDVYKSFYQDRFGAEHMISDTAAAREYLSYELSVAATDSVPNPYYEETGARGRYVRVYLRCVTEGLLTEEQLLDAFIRSAVPVGQVEQSWADEWTNIEQTARKAGLCCSKEEHEQLLQAAQSNRAVHHSDAYRNAYHPYYRIVERTIFESDCNPQTGIRLATKPTITR